MEGVGLKELGFRNQHGFLFHVNAYMKREDPELMLYSLRALNAYLLKFNPPSDIPIKDISKVGLLETIFDAADYEGELLGEITRCALKSLTIISYSYSAEVSSQVKMKKVVRLCQSGDRRTQEAAMKLICNLLSEEQSRSQVLASDGLFGIFHGALSDNRAALKYALAALLNLTFSTNQNSSKIVNQIAGAGGIAHVLAAI